MGIFTTHADAVFLKTPQTRVIVFGEHSGQTSDIRCEESAQRIAAELTRSGLYTDRYRTYGK